MACTPQLHLRGLIPTGSTISTHPTATTAGHGDTTGVTRIPAGVVDIPAGVVDGMIRGIPVTTAGEDIMIRGIPACMAGAIHTVAIMAGVATEAGAIRIMADTMAGVAMAVGDTHITVAAGMTLPIRQAGEIMPADDRLLTQIHHPDAAQ